MLKSKIGLAVIYHPYEVGAEGADKLLSKTSRILVRLGLEVISSGRPIYDESTATEAGRKFDEEGVDLICLPLATWSSDYTVLDMLEQVDVPVITWAFPGINSGSLCGCQQIDCVLKELDKEYKFVYGENELACREIETYSRAIALRNKLRAVRLGLIGYRTVGMTEVAFDEYALKSVIGPRIVHMGVEELLQGMPKVPAKRVQSKWDEVKTRVGKVAASEDEGLNSVRAYFTLKRFVEEHGLSGLATECYPNLMGQVCLAHALLGEEGIVAACEGDVNSAVAMLMLFELTGRPVHNTDLLAVHESDESAIFSHCGSGSFCLAERKSDIVLGPVRLAHKGVCVLFPSRRGEVTLVNLVGGRETYRMCVVSARASTTKMVFPGNPIRIKMPTGTGEFLDTIAESGFGHHWMIGYGNVIDELTQLGKAIGIKVTAIPGKEP